MPALLFYYRTQVLKCTFMVDDLQIYSSKYKQVMIIILSAERVMKEQEFHQLKPPKDSELHDNEGLGHQKLGQEMIGLVSNTILCRWITLE